MFNFFCKKCLVKREWKILSWCCSVDGILELKRMGMVMAVVTDGCMKTRTKCSTTKRWSFFSSVLLAIFVYSIYMHYMQGSSVSFLFYYNFLIWVFSNRMTANSIRLYRNMNNDALKEEKSIIHKYLYWRDGWYMERIQDSLYK